MFDCVGDGHCSRLDVASAGNVLDAVALDALLVAVDGDDARDAGSCLRIRVSTRCQTV